MALKWLAVACVAASKICLSLMNHDFHGALQHVLVNEKLTCTDGK
jgi:hypothetical protein